LTSRFDELLQALEEARVTAQTSLPAMDPELVLVFETRGSVADVFGAARNAGIELLIEVEGEFDPDEDFQKAAARPALVPGFVHVGLTNLAAMRQLRQLWELWSAGQPLPPGLGGMNSGLASLFSHLNDVRPWGADDRIRTTGLLEAIAERLSEGIAEIPVEVELWYFSSPERRAQAQASVRSIIEAVGGRVVGTASHQGFGYHGVAAVMPGESLRPLLEQGPGAIQLLRSRDIFLVRPGGQSVLPPEDVQIGSPLPTGALSPTGDPTVALLDGLPVTNHARLAGRLNVLDGDGLDDGTYEPRLRRHGTQMASLIVWGDLGNEEAPLGRPLLVRPILKPDPRTQKGAEAVPDGTLLPDLMVRVFRELWGGEDRGGRVPTIRILNLSVCDPHAPFDMIPSAWARAIDWLAEEYGVLVVVSAGNHAGLEITTPMATFEQAEPDVRRRLVLEALAAQALSRRLLNPAESVNGLTVGALHSDSAGDYYSGHRVDPLGDAPIPSPVSAFGRGFRRSVKPDIFSPGGRQLYTIDPGGPLSSTRLRVSEGTIAPGLRAACPTDADPTRGEVHTRGTSGAAALTTRRAAELLDLINALRSDVPNFEDRHVAVALKALVVHGSEWPDTKLLGGAIPPASVDRYFGYGWLASNHALGCPSHGVTVLAVGDLRAREEEDIILPLPPGLSGLVGRRRVTASLAWLTPINWRHRQYRRAKLGFHPPAGSLKPVVSSKQVVYQRAQRGTVQHQVFEGTGAVPIGPADELRLTVQCLEQAGGLGGREVPYAVALTLEVAEPLGVDVYGEVAVRIRPPVAVIPRI
jgi:hypothetical protein